MKLLHIERCKYISANGFFSINYSTMFGVSYIIQFDVLITIILIVEKNIVLYT